MEMNIIVEKRNIDSLPYNVLPLIYKKKITLGFTPVKHFRFDHQCRKNYQHGQYQVGLNWVYCESEAVRTFQVGKYPNIFHDCSQGNMFLLMLKVNINEVLIECIAWQAFPIENFSFLKIQEIDLHASH